NTMAEQKQNVPTQTSYKNSEQIGPRSQRLTNRGKQLLFNAQKISERTPSFRFQKAISNYSCIPAHPFELPPSGNTVIDFVNELGAVMGRVYSRDPDIFLTQGKPQSQSEEPKRRNNNNIHRRPDSAVHHTGDDYILGNLKFVPKGESVEVFGMAIPDPLITEAIQQSSYYPKYLEMVAENTKKTPQESASVQPATKRATPKKPTTTTPVKQSKPAPPPTKKPSKRKLPQKVRKGKPTFQLVDEDDEAQQESISQEEDDDPDLEMAKKMSLEAHQEKGEGEGDDADMERAIKLSLDPAFLPQGRAPVGGVMIRDPVSETTSKLHEVVGKGKAGVMKEQMVAPFLDVSSSSVISGHSSQFITEELQTITTYLPEITPSHRPSVRVAKIGARDV
ncbi:histone deacetylase 14, partial [Tanacetum coccineum]